MAADRRDGCPHVAALATRRGRSGRLVDAEDRPVTCSTCDGYELVPDPAGGALLVSCPDCPRKLRCPVHGRIVYAGETCSRCRAEARTALPLVLLLADDLLARVAPPAVVA